MISMAMDSAKLFFCGKLFKDPFAALLRLCLGAVLGGAAVFISARCGLPLWGAAMVGGAVSGFAQPLLYKNLKYA